MTFRDFLFYNECVKYGSGIFGSIGEGESGLNENIKRDVAAALFAAMTAIFTQLIIPIQPVPITLGTMAVMMAGAVLGAHYGALSMIIYVLLGAAGLPVFAMAHGGVGVLIGPGGGFILGYILTAFVVGWCTDRWGHSFRVLIPAMIAGCLTVYACGVAWFMGLTGASMWSAMVMCMFPFLPGDVVKVLLGAFLVSRYRKSIHF